MRSKVIATLVALKAVILGLWLLSSHLPFEPGVVSAKIQPPEKAQHTAPRYERPEAAPEKGLMEAIKRKEEELRAREKELGEKMRHLEGVKGDIDARVKRLGALLKDLREVKARIDAFNNNKARRLVKIYESMAPRDAAMRMERLDDEMAASILGAMREKIAGKILGFVSVEKSVKISRVLKREVH